MLQRVEYKKKHLAWKEKAKKGVKGKNNHTSTYGNELKCDENWPISSKCHPHTLCMRLIYAQI